MKKYQNLLGNQKIIKDQSLMRHEDIRKQIRILPELESLIPPLHPTEFAQLEENIRKEGCREALLVWETTESALDTGGGSAVVYVLVDGHNRFAICQRNNLDFKIHLVSFDSLADVRFYMIDNQLGRRNLTPEQASYLRGLRYLNEKQEKGKYARQDHKGHFDPYASEDNQDHIGQNVLYDEISPKSTSERLAQRFNVSEKTIKRDADFAKGLNKLAPDLRSSILSGQTKVNKSSIQDLSRLDQPMQPLETLQDVELLVVSKEEKSVATPKPKTKANELSGASIEALKKKLSSLTQQLEGPSDNLIKVCDAIIRSSKELKDLLKAN